MPDKFADDSICKLGIPFGTTAIRSGDLHGRAKVTRVRRRTLGPDTMDETKMEVEGDKTTEETEEGSTEEEGKPALSRKRSGLRDRKVLAAQKKRKLGRETSLWSMADHALRARPVTTVCPLCHSW